MNRKRVWAVTLWALGVMACGDAETRISGERLYLSELNSADGVASAVEQATSETPTAETVIALCHFEPGEPGQTIFTTVDGSVAHFDHVGDYLGSCEGGIDDIYLDDAEVEDEEIVEEEWNESFEGEDEGSFGEESEEDPENEEPEGPDGVDASSDDWE